MKDTSHGMTSERKKADCGSAFFISPTFSIEKELLRKGRSLIAGVDEAGRGALAGPLCVGLVIYDRAYIDSLEGAVPGINDSKKLTARQRNAALHIINRQAILATSILVSHRTIDRLNINGATEYALNRLIETIPIRPDIVLLDGTFSFRSPVPIQSVPRGDSRSITIASASIVAKVRRDTILDRLDPLYPVYCFQRNKGYGTKHHMQAIRDAGCSPVHRKSYEPVKSLYP